MLFDFAYARHFCRLNDRAEMAVVEYIDNRFPALRPPAHVRFPWKYDLGDALPAAAAAGAKAAAAAGETAGDEADGAGSKRKSHSQQKRFSRRKPSVTKTAQEMADAAAQRKSAADAAAKPSAS